MNVTPSTPAALNFSSTDADANFGAKVYVQASEWVRLTNTIIWAIGGLVFPVCAGALGLGIKDRNSRPMLALISLLLFLFWVYVSSLYRKSAVTARNTLMAIEAASSIPPKMRLF